jgi:glycerol-3-phosphate O-acyltransferase
MPPPPLTHPYVPNVALKALYERIFERIQVEDGWADEVRALSQKGSVLYVLPNLNWLDFLALDYLTKRHNLPPLRYANDLGLWVLNPHGPNVPGRGLLNMLLPHKRHNPEEQLRDAVENGGSAALFLKRPPSVLDVAAGATGGRGMREGDALVRTIFRMQRDATARIILLPLVFVWSKSPDKVEVSPWDLLLGPRAWPTPTRALGQFAYNRKHASLRWGEAIDVGQLLVIKPSSTKPM